MSAEEVKKVMAVQWEEKEPYCMPHGYQYKLENVDNYLKEMDELLLEAGMEGLGYQSQAENIQKTALGMGLLNAYISTLMSEIDAQIDQPLYRGFQNEATEQLSRIRMEDYSTENTLGLKRHYKIHDAYGQIMEYDAQAVSLTMKDFLGLTSLNDNAGHGDLIGMPKEFSDFTNLFAVEYDKIKDNLKDETGKEVTLEEYLTYLNTKGEFDNKMDKPLQELISAILDVTIIKPLIEMCTGYDMITGEDLTDFERGLKGVFAVVDVVTLFIGIKASGVAKLFSREALETGGRIIATDLISNGTAYAVGKMGEELGLPLPITLMLSLGAGVTVSLTAGKYVFKDSAGNVVLEAGADEVDGIRTQIKQGVETGSDALKRGSSAVESGRYSLPQGISQEQFSNASKLLRDRVGDISGDIVVQGSRAKGTAKPTSDIDIALRVSGDKFDSLINQYFKTPNPGSAKERTMLHAIETGKIQAGEAKLSGLRKELQEILGMEVDISIIKQGGAFDNPPFIPFE